MAPLKTHVEDVIVAEGAGVFEIVRIEDSPIYDVAIPPKTPITDLLFGQSSICRGV